MFKLYYADIQDGSQISCWTYIDIYESLELAQNKVIEDAINYYQIEEQQAMGPFVVVSVQPQV
jgi:hypothetical protein